MAFLYSILLIVTTQALSTFAQASEPPTFSNSSNSAPPGKSSGLPISHQIGIAILSTALALGFPGNLFVVWSALYRVRHRSVTCLLVGTLASADAAVLLTAPFFLHYLSGGVRGWVFGTAVCKSVHYICAVNMYVSIYLIALMSADRWLATSRPFVSQRLRTKRTLTGVVLGIWLLAFIMALPMPFYRSNLQILKHKNISSFFCMPYHWGSVYHEALQYLIETLLGFILPFALIAFFYASVFRRLRGAMFQRRGRGSCLILLILGAFLLFWMPYHIINVLQVIGLLGDIKVVREAAKAARPNVTAFAYLSSSINPVLYVFAGSSHIRNAGLGFMAKFFEGTYSSDARSRTTSRSSVPDETSTFRKLTQRLGSLRGGLSDRGRVDSVTVGEEDVKRTAELKSLMTIAE